MARSLWIYVVMREYPNGAPGYLGVEAAFTVKHELRTWVSRQDSLKDLSFFRVRDGLRESMVTDMTLDEVNGGPYGGTE